MEVTDEEQAAMAIKLADNVRQMIREEIKAALEDYGFVASIAAYPLADHLSAGIMSRMQGNYMFQNAVKSVIRVQMDKT